MSDNKTRISEENILEIQECIKRLCKKVSYYTEDLFEIELGDAEIYIQMPGEEEGFSLTIEEFIEFDWQMDKFNIINQGRIQTTTLTYQIIKAETEDLEFYLKSTSDFYQEIEGAELSIVGSPIYLAIACILLDSYHDDFGTGYQSYTVIQIEYDDKRNKLSNEHESDLIYSYLFEIADTTGFVFYLSKIRDNDPELAEKIEILFAKEEGDNSDPEEEIVLKPLLNYSDAMRLYVSGLQTHDKELRLLNFYKIFEYFAPIVISIDSYNLLSKKLDSPIVLNPNRDYLKSIFELVNSTNQRLKDNELIKSVINECFDMVELFDYLPESIKKKVLGIVKEKKLTYKTGKEKLTQACNIIASTIYSTRNQVVHAKSNFEATGDECPARDLEQLNIFMREASARTIRWYSKLPDYQK
ncbi:hypothetical protein SAMN04489724_1084 [Algoriphagus locisalis]|uniref:Apea-like HEPN domain-containing protein n=1 Tax=Algoriphagus locisalis TaxID=305507 RepID=A0A1I6YM08_9BACT|nr:hypothetical protein [Algoriphagus locisalis]SFT51291.1 hypothetical protein SAMN04489724_1084 [Algoriphagus locisalis]